MIKEDIVDGKTGKCIEQRAEDRAFFPAYIAPKKGESRECCAGKFQHQERRH